MAVLIFSTAIEAQTPSNDGQATSPARPAIAALTNESVLKLADAGLGDDVIIAKINAASQVLFKTETDDLIALKKAGVTQPIISAMIRREGLGTEPSATNHLTNPQTMQMPRGFPGGEDLLMRLNSKDGDFDLVSTEGHLGTTYAVVTVLVFMDFPGTKASIRTKDPRPFITIQSSKSPQGRFFLVRCQPNEKDDTRSVKQGRHGMFSNKDLGAPDKDWTIPFEVKAVQPGVWRMYPKQDLKPGEYGVFGGGFGMPAMFDFGIDG